MYIVKMQHAYSHFIGFFIDVFCMDVDFCFLSFRHFNTGPMTLPTDVKWQCHQYVGPVLEGEQKGNTPYHYIPNYAFIFNLLGVMFLYTSVLGGVHEVAKALVTRGTF